MKKWMKRLLAISLLVLLVFPVSVLAEEDYWICENCWQGANTGDVCFKCGAPRPVKDPNFNDSLSQIPGETEWVSVDILRIDGSAYVKGKKDKYKYAPWQAIDEDQTSCWQFSAKNVKKKPAWLAMIVEGQTVDGIWIRNGNQGFSSKSKYLYPEYARLKDITLVFNYDDEDRESVSMEFTLSDENGGSWEKLDTGRQENVYDVWLYVDSIYKGKSQGNNACLSEIMLVQNTPAEYAKEPRE